MGPEFLTQLEARTALETPQIVLTWTYDDDLTSPLFGVPWPWDAMTLQRSAERFPEDETEGTTVLSESLSDSPTEAVGDTSVEGLTEYYYSLFLQYTEHNTAAINQDLDISRIGSQFGAVIYDERLTYTEGIDGASNATAIFTSAGSEFLTSGVQAGFILEIIQGAGADDGFYIIQSVDSETQVTLTSSLTLTDTNIGFAIYSHHERYWIAGVSYDRKATLWRYNTHTGMVDKKVDLSEILDLDEFVSAMALAETISGTKYLAFLTPKRYVKLPEPADLVATVESSDITTTWLLTGMPPNHVVAGAFLDLSVFQGSDTVYVLDSNNTVIRLLTESTGASAGTIDLSGLDDSDSSQLQGLAPDYTNDYLLIGNRNYVYLVDESQTSPDSSDVASIVVLREDFLADIGLYEDEFTGTQYICVAHHGVDQFRTYEIEETKAYLWQQPYVADSDCVALYHLDDESGSLVDATANGHDGTNGGMDYQATGKFNYGIESDSATDNVDISAISTSFNGSEGTLELWFQASIATVLDSGDSTLCTLEVDANNKVTIAIVSGQLSFSYVAGGTTSSVVADHPSADTEFHHYMISWSSTSDEVKAFVDDSQFGTTQTGLGTWAGSIATAYIGHNTQSALGIYDDVRISSVARQRYTTVQSYTSANKMYAFSGRDYDATYEEDDPLGFYYRDEFFTNKFMGGDFIIRNDYEPEKLYPQNKVIDDNEVIFRGPSTLPSLGHTGRLSRLLGLYLDRIADAREEWLKIYDRYYTDFDSIQAISDLLGLQGLDTLNWNVDKQKRFLRVMSSILKAGGRAVSYDAYAHLLGFLVVGDHLQAKFRFDSVHYNSVFDSLVQAIPFDTMGSFDTYDERFPLALLRWRIYQQSTKSLLGATSAVVSDRLLTDASATFTSTAQVGNLIKIYDQDSTGDNGKYIIEEVHSDTELKVDTDWPVGGLSGLTYSNNWEVPYPDPWSDYLLNRFDEHLSPNCMRTMHRDETV